MKLLLPLAFLLIGCNPTERRANEYDSIALAARAEYMERADSIQKSAYKFAFKDTIGVYAAPVQVLSAKLVKREYSNYRDIALSFKNVSGKTVSAIRFKWYGLNAFGDPADMGRSYIEGYGGGFTDDLIRPGRKDYGTWEILSKDAKTIVAAWPIEVAFNDGTSWKLK